ncbi:hypothetical protein JOM56_006905 [Amanita muscaria]
MKAFFTVYLLLALQAFSMVQACHRSNAGLANNAAKMIWATENANESAKGMLPKYASAFHFMTNGQRTALVVDDNLVDVFSKRYFRIPKNTCRSVPRRYEEVMQAIKMNVEKDYYEN